MNTTTYRIISIIDNNSNSKKETFRIERKINLLFFSFWINSYSGYEKFEKGKIDQVKFTTFSETEAYLFLKHGNFDEIIKSGNIYKFIYFRYSSFCL